MAIRNRIRSIAGALIPAIDAAVTAALALKADKDDLGIPEAATITPITGDEIAPALSGGVLGKITYSAIKTWVLSGLQIAWGSVTGKPTTLVGYGITDAEPAKGADDNYVTDAEKTNIGNLGTAAYTASTAYASALGADDNYVTDAEKTKLSNLSGTNTGDQNLSGYAPLASPTFTGTVTAPIHKATTTAGMVIKNSGGTTLLTIGKLDAGTGFSTGVAEGFDTTASGQYSHAEGYGTTASGLLSHAEGYDSTASGIYSHAEGFDTTASGQCSHAEGGVTTASGSYSHAEGDGTTASGDFSHAGGRRAKATLQGSRVITDSQDADETSTLADQLTYRFQNGYQFKGGAAVFSGAVSGSNLSGTNTGDQDITGLAVKSANLSDLASASTARTNLGLGTLATQSGTFSGTSSGTNTGNETAATIATALNAGTEDSAAADTDRIAVVSPAGGYMLLSTLWTWIAAYAGTLTNKTLTNPTVTDYTESVVAIGNSGTSQTLSLTNGTFQTVTLTGNCTFTMPTATAGKSFILKVLTGAGGYTAAFTGVKWPGAVTPTITATASKYDLISFVADGSAWSGSVIPNYTA